MTTLRLVFAGTPQFAVPCLQALIDAGHEIAAVFTQPDRPAGRGRKLQQSPVKALGLERNIPIFQPTSLKRDPDARARIRALAPDLMVVVAYGLLLPTDVLEMPRLGCVNVHASLLPRWRGAAPIQRAVLAGDTRSGVCIMAMEAGLDTGPIYLQRGLDLPPGETGGTLHDKLSVLGAQALVDALPGIGDGSLTPRPQDPKYATYAHKIDKSEATIDWSGSAMAIERQIRAFDPWPVAQTGFHGEVLRLWSAHASDAPVQAGIPGDVVATGKSGIAVATGAGTLLITRLQPPGKRPMSAADYLNAHRMDGTRFG